MSKPKAFVEPTFEALLKEYIDFAVGYVASDNQEQAQSLREALENNSELAAQLVQSFVMKRIGEIREQNYWALQMFRQFVTESDMVDLLALQYQLKRQVLVPADDSVFPPKPALMESNESLLQRFDLAPYQFHTTGTRAGYRFHALTLDERPTITVDSEEEAVVMRFEFPKEATPNPVKDAAARTTEPNSGKVTVALVSRENIDGTASAELISRASTYLNRDDIAQESDELTVKSGTPKPYKMNVVVYTGGDPSNDISKADAQAAATLFADKAHKLEGRVDRLELGHVFYSLNAKRVVINEPLQDVVCSWDEMPYCTEVVIHVRAE
ncbi:baseplate J/gp47 family protein [Vibrio splendidus]|uniref:baseplate J/gp47 family protein n=1 Tax=Vibrio splendidus TaxID=29497 RepID=UPI000C83242F|nr:baseplate J/gp47 family protein [Vibrio splendidus]PMI49570.1 baseplate J protein [Vibrio splendidus]